MWIGILDLKAKSPAQFFIGSNGYYGCSFCEQPGNHAHKHYFPFKPGKISM